MQGADSKEILLLGGFFLSLMFPTAGVRTCASSSLLGESVGASKVTLSRTPRGGHGSLLREL